MTRTRALYGRFRQLLREFAKFGMVGAVGLFVTNAVYGLLFVHMGAGPVTSATIATIVAAIATYLGNRYWSFRARQRTGVARELIIFAVLNGIGLLIQDAVVAGNSYLLGLGHDKAAGFVALNLGIALATLFRFWSYRRFVWVAPPGRSAGPGRGTGPETGAAAPLTGLAPLDRWVVVAGGVVFATLMAMSPWYGFHRDELYFLDCARHLQASYVDQPVLTPLLAWVSLKLFGVWLPGLRLWPALAAGCTVVISGLTARELGGGRRPQLLAAVAVGTMPPLLAAGHLAGPTALDVLAWAALAWVAVRIGRTGEARWWLAAGVILGVGLANKHSIGFFALAVVLGTVLSGGWRMVANRWFAAGAAVAAAFTVPDLWWQAQHQWATIAMTQALNHANGGLGNIGTWVAGQLIMVTPALVWVWPAGLRFLWRSGRPPWRGLAWAYGLLFAFFALTTGAKIYYLAGAYPCLLAAGCVAIDAWLAARARRVRALLLAAALTTAAALPLVLPVLPAADIGWTYAVNQADAESIGWPQLVQTVHRVWVSLPPAQRAHAVIFTANYGEAGAINNLGKDYGLPTAVSGHNSEWWWGPGNPRATIVIAVTPGPAGGGAGPPGFFTSFRPVAATSNPAGIHNQEWDGEIYLCTGPTIPWGQLWSLLRHYS